ncbi:MAG: Flagellar hook-basal body complex protein FliE [uncultured bacterium]|nr:MAG: Flagellar hook-basal body complex protein FliE [uncultured bacterium]
MNEINPSNISKIDVKKLYESKKNEILKNQSASGSPGFKNMLDGYMKDVNDLQVKADEKIEKLATGEIKDIHEVMVAATEADTSFKIMMEMRNKLMSAYKEISKMGQ